MNIEKYLPIGSLVLLKNATKKIMVVGFVAKSPTTGDAVYDYIGCLYPEGVISSDKNLLFNHDQIDKIFYMGYIDDEQKKFKEKLNELISNSGLDSNEKNINEISNDLKNTSSEQQTPAMPVFDTLNFNQQNN